MRNLLERPKKHGKSDGLLEIIKNGAYFKEYNIYKLNRKQDWGKISYIYGSTLGEGVLRLSPSS